MNEKTTFCLRTAHRIDPAIALSQAQERHEQEFVYYRSRGLASMMWGKTHFHEMSEQLNLSH